MYDREDWTEDDLAPTQRVPSPDVQTQCMLILLQRSFEYRVREGMGDFHDLLVDLSGHKPEDIRLLLNSNSIGGISLLSHVTASGIAIAQYAAIDAAMRIQQVPVNINNNGADKENVLAPMRGLGRK